jgi:hypothetical protein
MQYILESTGMVSWGLFRELDARDWLRFWIPDPGKTAAISALNMRAALRLQPTMHLPLRPPRLPLRPPLHISTRTFARLRIPVPIVPLSPVPIPQTPQCPPPTFPPCACDPPDLDIDRTTPLLGTMPRYSKHIVISTGKHDWASRVELDPSDNELAGRLKALLKKRGNVGLLGACWLEVADEIALRTNTHHQLLLPHRSRGRNGGECTCIPRQPVLSFARHR